MIQCIQDSGIAMAMLGMLYALPDTQLSRRLKKEGRLFEDSSVLGGGQKMIDQTSSGLNFTTIRPRIDILRDFYRIESFIYDPKNYFKRVTNTALLLKYKPKHRPGFIKNLRTRLAFVKLNHQLGKNRSTAWPYYKMVFKVLFKNPEGIESAVNLSAMFIHFYKQSQFIVKNIKQKIETLERAGKEKSGRILWNKLVPKNEYIEEPLGL